MDSVQIVIRRGVNADGSGGTIVDDASAVLGSIGDTPILDALVAAFEDAYGLHEVDGQPVSGFRNVSYRMRQFSTEIAVAYLQKVAAEQARTAAGQQAAAALAAVTIVE